MRGSRRHFKPGHYRWLRRGAYRCAGWRGRDGLPGTTCRGMQGCQRLRRREPWLAVDVDFLLTSLIVVASPGTGVLYTLATGLSRGSRASVVAAFGCTVGIVPHMA